MYTAAGVDDSDRVLANGVGLAAFWLFYMEFLDFKVS